jgi:hypothetical protein
MDPARQDATADVVRTYQVFARREARGRSPAYEALAEAAAADPGIMRFVASLPPAKRQPSLLFAADRYLLGVPAEPGSLRVLVRWLSCLVWPDEGDRAERLAAAIASARRAPPRVVKGDLLTGLPALVAEGLTVVARDDQALGYADSHGTWLRWLG